MSKLLLDQASTRRRSPPCYQIFEISELLR
jgi:hypothetical protein